MRASTAYFVGAGTIIAAIAIGLGGGIVAGNIMNPIAPKQGPDTATEWRAESAGAESARSERIQYLAGSQAFGATIAAPAQPHDEAKSEAKSEAKADAKPQAQTTQAKAEPPAPPPPPRNATEESKRTAVHSVKPAEQQASTEPASSPENANARAKDSDVKRAASERRRTERRERWAERRRNEFRDSRGMRDRTDWDDVARNIREDSDARDFAARPRGGFPQIRLFGPDDDD
ncbi:MULTISPECIES: hypothetical protein [unclassified Bradyrhizobium]|uniref:hypothetical protein n=1 Tax=unclassified Bradyrhizobium TaxID=2631580 RepID=UPI00247B208C|nr:MULTISPECIES: hypothetical protein [unclassified Bradyrhizobium]WGR72206.1 hypothetical protein MTX24_04450 [Bradyrhizobium sp. ISRA426]WGR77040.1 hypothetical protein MTX21_29400 [Bradyrhizobium sp. ISRA430]WGR87445.1 hypothetical protein MTX25_04450 [Bradyrhizobium sp. ISRA432]